MPTYKKLLFLFFTALLASITFGVVISKMSPYASNAMLSISLFYVSAFFALFPSLSIIVYLIRSLFSYTLNYKREFQISMRQSFLASLMIILTLHMQRLEILSIYTVLIPIGIFLLAELYFWYNDRD